MKPGVGWKSLNLRAGMTGQPLAKVCGQVIGDVRARYVNTGPRRPRGAWRALPVGGWKRFSDFTRTSLSHFVRPRTGERLRDGFPLSYLTLAGSRPGGRPTFLLYDKKVGKETYPAVAPPAGVPSFRVRQAGSAQTRPAGSNMRSPFPACRTLQSARQRGQEMQVIKGQCPAQVPQRLGVSEKPVPTPQDDPKRLTCTRSVC